jgi:nucleotide-binding universal stress UspA family protein
MSEGTQSDKTRIVVGADMSETGDQALRQAVALAKQLPNSELHITYVIRAERGLHDANRLEQMSRELRTNLETLRAHVTSVCAPPSGSQPFAQDAVFHLRLGEPAKALHQVAVDVDADMIVVGTHGRKGMDKLMLGSVAEELVRMAHLPVVVARAKDFSGLKKTDKVEPPKPGQDLHNTGLSDYIHLEFVPRTSHISGLV